ncbi:uncharacterized protein MKZ38_000451 [Zalerion maritima]|uniref:6-phosphogluconolactonase n=1 Tax=Zalerion maritima TaxID=339359 RepID=A0AAD5S5S4_9PEZI|nr:uncharacterized protein MKZ38_000451 [Zalerion maritima]
MLSLALLSLGIASMASPALAAPAPHESAAPGNCSGSSDAPRTLFFSSVNYTGSATFDPAANTLEVASNDTHEEVASWLLLGTNLVYSNHEVGSDVHVKQIGEGNALTEVQAINGSAGLVHFEFNADKTALFGAGFTAGDISIFDVGADGQLSNHRALKTVGAMGPDKVRQLSAHAHQVVRDPTGEFFVVNDLGLDSITVVGKQSADTDYEVLGSVNSTQTGSGPRHGAFFPVGIRQATHYFLVCEMFNIVEIFEVSYPDGVLTLAQTGKTLSTYPTEGEFVLQPPAEGEINGFAAEIFVSHDNAHVYVTNRISGNPTDSIAHFTISGIESEETENEIVTTIGDISLELTDLISTGGVNPRMFSLSRDGNYVYLGNQNKAVNAEDGEGKGLVVFKRDAETGLLEEVASLPYTSITGGSVGVQFVQEF